MTAQNLSGGLEVRCKGDVDSPRIDWHARAVACSDAPGKSSALQSRGRMQRVRRHCRAGAEFDARFGGQFIDAVDSLVPNQRLERTATSRLDFDAIGSMSIDLRSQSARSVAVAHPQR